MNVQEKVKLLWAQVPEKVIRRTEAVMQRHALYAAAMHNRVSKEYLAEITGLDRTSFYHPEKMHEGNILIPIYRDFYLEYSAKLEESQDLVKVTKIEQEIEATKSKLQVLELRLKEALKPNLRAVAC